MQRFVFILICSYLFNLASFSQVKIPKTEKKPVIDGLLLEPLWTKAKKFTDFKMIQPDYGLAPSELTEIYLTYNETHFFIAIKCLDKEPEKIQATLSNRDNPGNDDWVAFCLDSFNDETNAFFFMVTPLGVQVDGTLDANASPNILLDMIWESAVIKNQEGYVSEFAIPFKSIRFQKKDVVQMGFKAARFISRKSEEVDFPYYHPERGAALAQFQKIELTGIQHKQVREILPAITLSKNAKHQEGSYLKSELEPNISLTGKIGLTSGLTLDATINPDFSTVETDADQVDINLRNALFYPERRSFFLEGLENFQFAANENSMPLQAIINTRNVVDPIIGLKLSGKIGTKNTISTIYSVDEFPQELGLKKAHFSSLRFARQLKKDNYAGLFFTGKNIGNTHNYVLGGDGRFRINERNVFEYHAFGSHSKNESIEKGYSIGSSYRFSTRKWFFRAGLFSISENFQTDWGYIIRQGLSVVPVVLRYSHFNSTSNILRVDYWYSGRLGHNQSNNLWEYFNALGMNITMPLQTQIELSGWLASEVFRNQHFSRNGINLRVESQPFKFLAFELNGQLGKYIFYDWENPFQGEGYQIQMALTLQPIPRINSSFGLTHTGFYQEKDHVKVYDFTIFRNRTNIQFNQKLFFRTIAQYNAFHQQFDLNFLISYTHRPGTVIYLGYGSIHEKVQWQQDQYIPAQQFLNTERHYFFKASYLWRF